MAGKRILCIVVGTRPEIIKMAPVIHACKKAGRRYFLLHTGQHYSPELDKIFFEQLRVGEPDYNLAVGSGGHAEMIAKIVLGISEILEKERPSWVLVHGDTNSALGGALAAAKLGIKVAHVEAGLRSYDRGMPEEVNRVLIDHVADALFAPTETARENLLREGRPRRQIVVTGNTVVEAVKRHLPVPEDRSRTLGSFGVSMKRYRVMTLHRPSNVDDPRELAKILRSLAAASHDMPLLFFAHPRTQKRIADFKLKVPRQIRLLAPVGYFEMLSLIKHAAAVITDSGGLQEEACILGTPCITLRQNTERPETIAVKSNVLVADPARLPAAFKKSASLKSWKQPFGSANASAKILRAL